MSNAIENTRFIMCNALNQIRKAKKHPRLLDIFENAMEYHLEALRLEYERTVMTVTAISDQSNILHDAYERQKQLTHSACVSYRELEDEHRDVLADKKHLGNAHEQVYAKLQESTAKLASQAQSIQALLRVVKSQQNSCARLQRGLDESMLIINRDKAKAYAEAEEAHRQIMQAEAIADERWDLLESKQKTIVSQRNRIKELVYELLLAKKPAKRHGFWLFWMRKSTKAKLLPKKTN